VIKVTRLNGKALVVNAELIRFVEETPDTLITLRGNEKIMVREKLDEVVRRAIEYGRSLRVVPM